MSLRSALMWHITTAVLGCFVVVAALVAWHVAGLQQQATQDTADRAVLRIERQLEVGRALSMPPAALGDLGALLESEARPGQCIELRQPSEAAPQRYCKGMDADSAAVPAWFAAAWPEPGVVVRGTRQQGPAAATIRVETDALQGAAEAWSRLVPLIGLCGATLGLLWLLLSVLLRHALAPLDALLRGLDQLAEGAAFKPLGMQKYREFDRLAGQFDRLALALERRTAERDALTQRLVDVQEAERRHIARELHDELGQSLAAVQALAASIGATAEPGSSSRREAQRIEQLVAPMMHSLRSLLLQLHPPGLSEFGLERSLRHLVAEWNGRGSTRFHFSAEGDFTGLSDAVSTNLFRVAQECMTNAVKHADASQVSVRMQRLRAEPALELVVQDDGIGKGEPDPERIGLGVLGMRERIAVLGGRLDVRRLSPQGRQVSARVPLPAD